MHILYYMYALNFLCLYTDGNELQEHVFILNAYLFNFNRSNVTTCQDTILF